MGENKIIERIQACEPFLRKRALFLCKGNIQESEGLYQETVIKLLKSKTAYDKDKGASFKTFASVVMKNKFIDMYRSKKVRAMQSWNMLDLELVGNDGVDLSQIVGQMGTARNEGAHTDNCQFILDSINSLRDKSSAILNKRLEGVSYGEISAQLDLPLATIKSRLFRAKKELKTILEKEWGELTL